MDSMIERRFHRDDCAGQAAAPSVANGPGLVLDRLLELLEGLGEGFSGDWRRVRELRRRLTEERFHLAALGQFKRGKSTLMNAFLGEALLPTSVVPVTSIPTFLRAGPKRLVRVLSLDGKSTEFPDLSSERAAQILADYVTEERNPANRLGVASVEVEHPSFLLRQGVVMIDTPGIGSTFRHNTEATLNFLPQCDAALFMVSADPPITEVEVEFLKAVRGKVSRLFFVLNKADYLTEEERDTAIGFFKKVLREQVGFDAEEPVFSVSARRGLQAKLGADKSLWEESGLSALQGYLLDFLAGDKTRTLHSALARKAVDVVANAILRVRLERSSLQIPLEDLERRIQIFDGKMAEVERERIAIGDLLVGDRKRGVEFLEQRAEESRRKARGHLEHVAGGALQRIEDPALTEAKVQDCLSQEIPAFFEGELGSLSEAVDRRVEEPLRRHQDRADNLIETVRRTAAELFDIPYRAPDSSRAVERTHKPYWVTHHWSTSIGTIPKGLVDRLLPASGRQRRIMKRLAEDIETLVVHNVENIRWATLRNVDDAFRRFASDLDERLQETLEATRAAFRAARLRREQQRETVEPEIQRLTLKETEMAALSAALVEFACEKPPP